MKVLCEPNEITEKLPCMVSGIWQALSTNNSFCLTEEKGARPRLSLPKGPQQSFVHVKFSQRKPVFQRTEEVWGISEISTSKTNVGKRLGEEETGFNQAIS